MAQASEHFVCPCCGMHAPIERITEEGPFELAMWRKTLGGKRKLTDEEREERYTETPLGFRPGSAPGLLDYQEIPLTEEIRESFNRRLQELTE